jgi:beta-mannosidase
VSPVEDGGTVKIWGVSDRRTATPAHLSLRLLDFAGRELWRRDQDVRLTANASGVLVSLGKREILAGQDAAKVVLVAELTEGPKRLSRNTLSFVKAKDLDLPAADIHTDVEPRPDGAFTVRLTSRHFARDVMLSTTSSGGVPVVDGFFEDNAFDLLAGETATVVFRPATSTTVAALRAAVRATSLVDTY